MRKAPRLKRKNLKKRNLLKRYGPLHFRAISPINADFAEKLPHFPADGTFSAIFTIANSVTPRYAFPR